MNIPITLTKLYKEKDRLELVLSKVRDKRKKPLECSALLTVKRQIKDFEAKNFGFLYLAYFDDKTLKPGMTSQQSYQPRLDSIIRAKSKDGSDPVLVFLKETGNAIDEEEILIKKAMLFSECTYRFNAKRFKSGEKKPLEWMVAKSRAAVISLAKSQGMKVIAIN